MHRVVFTFAALAVTAGSTRAHAESPKRVAISTLRHEAVAPRARTHDYATLLDTADVDGDAHVTGGELESLVVRHVRARIELRFGRLDRNADGRVTRAEVPTMNRARFARLDLNRDGSLTAAELGSVLLAQARARCRVVFAELDRDRDGVISAVDRAAADAERVSQR